MKPAAIQGIIAGALVLEIAAIALLASATSPAIAWLLHSVSVLGCIGGLAAMQFQVKGNGGKLNVSLWLVLLLAAIPGFGPWLVGVPALIWMRPSMSAKSIRFLGPEDVYHGDETQLADPDYEATDILSIIRSASDDERRRAILGLRTYDPTAAVPVLRRCLQDSDELVRIYAQGILQNLQENLEKQTRNLRNALETEGNTAKCIQLELQLAETLHEFVYLDLVDENAARQSILQDALSAVQRATTLAPERNDLRFIELRYQLELRQVDQADRTMHKLVSENFDNFLLQPWACELAFQKRDWARLRQLTTETEQSRMAYGRMLTACAFWRKEAS